MARPDNAEFRSAIRDEKRVRVAISSPGSASYGLKLLVHAEKAQRSEGESRALSQPGIQPALRDLHSKPIRLTARELQVLRLIARGLHNREIAARIHRSIKTVEKHRQHLHAKLSTHEVAGLTRQALAMGLMGPPRRAMTALKKGGKQLTPRELEVLRLVASGSGNKWIASELHRSIKTVDHHRENIMKKLGIHEVAGLTRHALSIGLL
jgi:DNA-binding NarL/FixJ family response regulator